MDLDDSTSDASAAKDHSILNYTYVCAYKYITDAKEMKTYKLISRSILIQGIVLSVRH